MYVLLLHWGSFGAILVEIFRFLQVNSWNKQCSTSKTLWSVGSSSPGDWIFHCQSLSCQRRSRIILQVTGDGSLSGVAGLLRAITCARDLLGIMVQVTTGTYGGLHWNILGNLIRDPATHGQVHFACRGALNVVAQARCRKGPRSPRGLLFFGHLNKITVTVTVTVISTTFKLASPTLTPVSPPCTFQVRSHGLTSSGQVGIRVDDLNSTLWHRAAELTVCRASCGTRDLTQCDLMIRWRSLLPFRMQLLSEYFIVTQWALFNKFPHGPGCFQ